MPSMTAEQANIALRQMGGTARLTLMAGAKDFGYGQDADGLPYVSFKFKGHPKMNYVSIALAPDDTYTVRFGKIVKYTVNDVNKYTMVYASDLRNLFERTTGLYLSL